MMDEKKKKILKNVGLVVLTIVVLVSVFLAIYFTNEKNPDDETAINTYIGQGSNYINRIPGGSFQVTNKYVVDTIGDKKAHKDKVFMTLYITYRAVEDDITIRRSDLNLSGFKFKSGFDGYLGKNLKVKKGETKQVKLVFEMPSSYREHFLYCYGYRVKLGAAVISESITK